MEYPCAGTWVQAAGGALVRADAIIMLHCEDGVTGAVTLAGQQVRLAGPGCPDDFHRHLLAEIAASRLLDGDRHTVIITAGDNSGQTTLQWTASRQTISAHDYQATHRQSQPRAPAK